ncbi:MAG TPA: GNAT family N-acetyltransferase [Mucilaginibacter sp.]|jgi:ribosomal-protein-alanine N-acetyltransferase|nr:GNAT family N-acetyltransferase [Mucilaginibacter sp.]
MSIITITNQLIIREFLPDELELHLHHFDDEMVARYIPKRSRQERINIFNHALAGYLTTKSTGMWGIFSKSTGDFIGGCLLRPFNNEPGVIELGYSIEAKYWGQGIGTEMAKAMVIHGFADKSITTIVALTDQDNTGSRRVLEKAGFTQQDNLIREGEELAFYNIARA